MSADQDLKNNLKDAQEDISAGDGKGNGEGLGNETQAQQDAFAHKIATLQAQAAQLAGSDYEAHQKRLKIEDEIRTLQKQEAESR